MTTRLEGRYLGAEEIVEVLLKHTSITRVDLNWKDFRGKEHELEMIFDVLLSYPITHLYLRFCKLGNSELKIIASRIKDISTLTHLDLMSNEFNDEGGRELAKAISAGIFSLVWFACDVSRNCIGDIGALALLEAILNGPSRSTIQELYIRDQFGNATRGDMVTLTAAQILRQCASLLHFAYEWGSHTAYDTLVVFFNELKLNTKLLSFGTLSDVPLPLLVDCFEENNGLVETYGSLPPRYALVNRICKEMNASEVIRKSVPKSLHTSREIAAFVKEFIQVSEDWNALKLVVLGNGEIGKTSLLDVFHNLKANTTKEFETIKPRTIGIDVSYLTIGSGLLTIYDFGGQMEYTVTHQFFLSVEMVVYLVCFDLGATREVQSKQLAYWLSFLNSALPTSASPASAATPKWKVLIVGLKEDLRFDDNSLSSENVFSFMGDYPNLPLFDQLFHVSASTGYGVTDLLSSIEEVCAVICERHTTRIPASIKSLLHSFLSIQVPESILTIRELHFTHSQGMSEDQFVIALKYLHSIGRVVLLKGGLICVYPQIIPKLAAKFISPLEVRVQLRDTPDVELLEEEAIGIVLGQLTPQKLRYELTVLEEAQVCFRLSGPKMDRPIYLFPSLTSHANEITFSLCTDTTGEVHFKGIRFTVLRNQIIFIPGFFCQLIVSIFSKLNISRRELIKIHNNGAVMRCEGLFVGELIVKIEDNSRSILFLMLASNPDLSFAVNAFKLLVAKHFQQYYGCEEQIICPTCIDSAFSRSELRSVAIGVIDPKDRLKEFQICSPHRHQVRNEIKPPPKHLINMCRAHKKTSHDFFMNYRVSTEGRKLSKYSSETEGGFAELFYETLATRKRANGDSVFVFWDSKCLNIGQDWEHGFMHGISNSIVIILLISNKTVEGIAANVSKKLQDNVLIEYECALIQNVRYGTPVFPVFVAELKSDGSFEKFDSTKAKTLLTDTPHTRNDDAQAFVDELSEPLAEKKKRFLSSAYKTILKLFKLQGKRLDKRGEDPVDLTAVMNWAMEALESQPAPL